MQPRYRVTGARRQDLPLLPAIELAAAVLLNGHAPASVLCETISVREFRAAQRAGRLWVALDGDTPVGFSQAEVLSSREAHLTEIDVHPTHGRRGLGTLLVAPVCEWAAAAGYPAVTLTTFRDVPWNMPFYARLGFEVVPAGELSTDLLDVVEDETRRGLDPLRRVVMRRLVANKLENAIPPIGGMQTRFVVLLDEVQCQKLDAFLVERIYEFNSKATGYFDGRLFGASVQDEAGEVIAGFNGHTWGGCAKISNLWVSEHHRGHGLGKTLLQAAEAEAVRRGCTQVVLTTHSFQAPGFYEQLGYERKCAIEDRPKGYSNIVFVKALDGDVGR